MFFYHFLYRVCFHIQFMWLNLLDVAWKNSGGSLFVVVVFKPYVWAKRWFDFPDYRSHRLQRNGCSFCASHRWVCSIWTATRSSMHIWNLDQRWKFHALNLPRIECQHDASIYARWWSCQWLAHVVPCAVESMRNEKKKQMKMPIN